MNTLRQSLHRAACAPGLLAAESVGPEPFSHVRHMCHMSRKGLERWICKSSSHHREGMFFQFFKSPLAGGATRCNRMVSGTLSSKFNGQSNGSDEAKAFGSNIYQPL